MDILHELLSPVWSGALLTVGLFGLLLEMQTLHGIAGLVAIIALVLFFAAHVVAGGAGAFVIALAVLGLLMIVYELHIVPGHTFPGVMGTVLLLASAVLAFGPLGAAAFFVALQTIASAIILTIVLFYFATRAFPQNAWISRLSFAGAQGADFVTSSDYSALLGHTGEAVSYLRPAGVAAIDGRRVDVLTSGEFIPQGTPVRVTRVEGARVFVEPIALERLKE
jgi:membrane-bound serine protease (ClpP class)